MTIVAENRPITEITEPQLELIKQLNKKRFLTKHDFISRREYRLKKITKDRVQQLILLWLARVAETEAKRRAEDDIYTVRCLFGTIICQKTSGCEKTASPECHKRLELVYDDRAAAGKLKKYRKERAQEILKNT